MKMSRRQTLAMLSAAVLIAGIGRGQAEEPMRLRISLDTGPSHVRTLWTEKFAATVREKSGGKIDAQVFHSGQLFKDANVAKALRQGSVEMAIPGMWVLGGFEKRLDACTLPAFYGLGAKEFHAVYDGPIGQEMSASLEEKLDVKVLGRWMDLGPSHTLLGSRKVERVEEFKGMKIRYPGSAGLAARVEQMGATPTMVPWPDVPLALSRGNFDGLISTYESAKSAKLWESGLKFVYEDFHSFGQYVPMINATTWKKLAPEQQKLLVETWEAIIPAQRQAADQAQQGAARDLEASGVVIVRPSPEQRKANRQHFLAGHDKVAEQIGIDAAYARRVAAAVTAIAN